MGFCNATGVNFTSIVQAKWLSSYGIVSQLSVTTLDLYRQAIYPPCAALILAAAAGPQVPYACTRIETRTLYVYGKKLLLKLSRIDIALY